VTCINEAIENKHLGSYYHVKESYCSLALGRPNDIFIRSYKRCCI